MIERTTAVREDWHNLQSSARIRAAMREAALGLMEWTHPDADAHAYATDTVDGSEKSLLAEALEWIERPVASQEDAAAFLAFEERALREINRPADGREGKEA